MEDLFKGFAEELELRKARRHSKKEMDKAYHASIKEGAFDEALKKFPKANDISHPDHEDAVDHIQDHIAEKHGVNDKTGYLNDTISGGLA